MPNIRRNQMHALTFDILARSVDINGNVVQWSCVKLVWLVVLVFVVLSLAKVHLLRYWKYFLEWKCFVGPGDLTPGLDRQLFYSHNSVK